MVEAEPARSLAFLRTDVDIAVLGVGDEGRSDLGVGVRMADALRGRLPSCVRVLALASIGPQTECELDPVTHLLAIDCVDVGRAPGTVVLFDGGVLTPCVAAASIREPGLVHILVLAGQHADAPEEVALLGVQPACIEPGTTLSAEVRAAVPELLDKAEQVIGAWLDPSSRNAGIARDRPPGC